MFLTFVIFCPERLSVFKFQLWLKFYSVCYISTYKRLTAVIVRSLFGPDDFSSKRVWLLMVDCWIECCNADHLENLETGQIRRQWADFSVITVPAHLYRSPQHKSRQRSAQYGYFTDENVSRAFTYSVKVTATEFFLFQLQRVYRNWHVCRGQKTGHLSKPKLFNVKLQLTRHTDHKNGTIY